MFRVRHTDFGKIVDFNITKAKRPDYNSNAQNFHNAFNGDAQSDSTVSETLKGKRQAYLGCAVFGPPAGQRRSPPG
jgi:hypothetical protein